MIIPFQITDWDKIPGVVHPGEKGEAIWKTLQYEGLRIRGLNILPATWPTTGVPKDILFIASKAK